MTFTLSQQVKNPNLTGAGTSATTGPLSDLNSRTYDYTLYQYPTSINEDFPDQRHQIIFYINVPNQSYWNNTAPNAPTPVVNRNQDATNYGLRPDSTSAPNGSTINASSALGITNFILSNQATRTQNAISLYIPNTMVWSQQAEYENVSLADTFATGRDVISAANLALHGKFGQAGAAVSSIINDLAKDVGISTGKNLKEVALQAAGVADNPQNFLLFKQMNFRKFQFDFLLTPENPQETQIINQIIYLFRFNQVPEVATNSMGRFFIPPSTFDIDILHNDNINTNIPKISTCFCNSVNVDWGAAGQWATYKDGQPIQVRLTIDMTELSILTKDLVQQGF